MSRDRKKGRFGKRTRVALDGVTFTIERGETVAILGQNGSGKSTLVRLLSTLLLPDGGSARIFGHDVVTEHRAVRRLVNRVSVEASFFKKMSAAENLSYAARYYGMTAGQTRRQDPGDPRAGRLPAGPARRADGEPLARDAAEGRARAGAAHLAGRAAARRADDGARPRSKLEVQDFIREIRTSHDSTILLCTHDLGEAEILAERVGILDRGRLLVLEPADEIKRATARRRSRRRSSRPPAASSRPRTTRTTTREVMA